MFNAEKMFEKSEKKTRKNSKMEEKSLLSFLKRKVRRRAKNGYSNFESIVSKRDTAHISKAKKYFEERGFRFKTLENPNHVMISWGKNEN